MIGTFWNLCRACPSVPVDKLHSEYRSTYRWHELAGQRQEIIRRAPQNSSSIGSGCCEPAIPRRRKHPELAYRTHDFLVSLDGGTEHLLEKSVIYDRARSEERWSHNRQKTSRRSKSEGPPTAQTSYRLLNNKARDEYDAHGDKVPEVSQKMSQSLEEKSTIEKGGTSEYKLQFAWPPVSAVLSSGLANICVPRKSISMSGIKSKGHIDEAVPVHRRTLAAKAHKEMSAMNGLIPAAEPTAPNNIKPFSSEYKKQFQPFYNYNYDENRGTWDEKKMMAAPENPPLYNENNMVLDTTNSNWYKEVVMLRKKANQYRHRGWGTELVPDHIAQLYNDQISVWEQVSRRSTLSALSLATTLITKSSRSPSKEDKEREARKGSPIKSSRSRSARSESEKRTRTPASARSEPPSTKGNARTKPKSLERASPKTRRSSSRTRGPEEVVDGSEVVLPTVRRQRPSKDLLNIQENSSNTSMATTASIVGSSLSSVRLSTPRSRTQSARLAAQSFPAPRVRNTVNYDTPKPTKPRSRSSPPRCSRLARDDPSYHAKPPLPSRIVRKPPPKASDKVNKAIEASKQNLTDLELAEAVGKKLTNIQGQSEISKSASARIPLRTQSAVAQKPAAKKDAEPKSISEARKSSQPSRQKQTDTQTSDEKAGKSQEPKQNDQKLVGKGTSAVSTKPRPRGTVSSAKNTFELAKVGSKVSSPSQKDVQDGKDKSCNKQTTLPRNAASAVKNQDKDASQRAGNVSLGQIPKNNVVSNVNKPKSEVIAQKSVKSPEAGKSDTKPAKILGPASVPKSGENIAQRAGTAIQKSIPATGLRDVSEQSDLKPGTRKQNETGAQKVDNIPQKAPSSGSQISDAQKAPDSKAKNLGISEQKGFEPSSPKVADSQKPGVPGPKSIQPDSPKPVIKGQINQGSTAKGDLTPKSASPSVGRRNLEDVSSVKTVGSSPKKVADSSSALKSAVQEVPKTQLTNQASKIQQSTDIAEQMLAPSKGLSSKNAPEPTVNPELIRRSPETKNSEEKLSKGVATKPIGNLESQKVPSVINPPVAELTTTASGTGYKLSQSVVPQTKDQIGIVSSSSKPEPEILVPTPRDPTKPSALYPSALFDPIRLGQALQYPPKPAERVATKPLPQVSDTQRPFTGNADVVKSDIQQLPPKPAERQMNSIKIDQPTVQKTGAISKILAGKLGDSQKTPEAVKSSETQKLPETQVPSGSQKVLEAENPLVPSVATITPRLPRFSPSFRERDKDEEKDVKVTKI